MLWPLVLNLKQINKLIINHHKTIEGMSIKMTLDFNEADDLFQDTCIKLITNHDKYTDLKESSFLNYVKVVMLRIYLNRIRKYKHINKTKDLYENYRKVTDIDASISDFNLLYESMTKCLKNSYELNVIDLLIKGFTFKEIGSAFNTSPITIHTRHRLVRIRLIERLA